jgi:Fuc2NAc and GlcNAc transferase
MMGEFLILSILSIVGSYALVLAVRSWALNHMLDVPNERSSHTAPVPRGGGLGIVVMTLVGSIAAYTLWSADLGAVSPALLITGAAAFMIAAIGWIDDKVSLPAKLRLLLQLGIGAGCVLLIGAIDRIALPVMGVVVLPGLIALVVNILWVVGFTNIYNFLDGIDGIAGTQALVGGAAWCALLLTFNQPNLALVGMLIATSSIGFLLLNRPPARIFMGDVGSTFLGFSFAMLPLVAYQQLENSRLLGAGVLFVAPFALDGVFTIVSRLLRRENVLQAHHSHVYQRLIRLGYSHGQITLLYGLFALVSAFCGMTYAVTKDGLVMGIAILTPILLFAALAIWTTRQEQRKKQRQ